MRLREVDCKGEPTGSLELSVCTIADCVAAMCAAMCECVSYQAVADMSEAALELDSGVELALKAEFRPLAQSGVMSSESDCSLGRRTLVLVHVERRDADLCAAPANSRRFFLLFGVRQRTYG